MSPITPVLGGALTALVCTACNAQDYYREAAESIGGYGGAVAGTYCCGPAGGVVGAGSRHGRSRLYLRSSRIEHLGSFIPIADYLGQGAGRLSRGYRKSNVIGRRAQL